MKMLNILMILTLFLAFSMDESDSSLLYWLLMGVLLIQILLFSMLESQSDRNFMMDSIN